MKLNIDCLFLGDAIFDVTVMLHNTIKPIVFGGVGHSKHISLSPGGTGNVATVFSALGGIAAQCAVIGDDPLGVIYNQDLLNHKIVPILFKNKKYSTGILLSYVSQNGQRSFLVSRGANSHLKHSHVDKVFKKFNPKILYISGHMLSDNLLANVTVYAAKLAANKKIKIFFACTPYNLIKKNCAIYEKLLKMTYCLCLNLEEARALTGKKTTCDIVENLSNRVPLLALTLGKKGCIISTKDNLTKINAPTVRVVDTTGAGDAFAGAMIFGIIKNLDYDKMAKLGIKMATKVIQQIGPRFKDH